MTLLSYFFRGSPSLSSLELHSQAQLDNPDPSSVCSQTEHCLLLDAETSAIPLAADILPRARGADLHYFS